MRRETGRRYRSRAATTVISWQRWSIASSANTLRRWRLDRRHAHEQPVGGLLVRRARPATARATSTSATSRLSGIPITGHARPQRPAHPHRRLVDRQRPARIRPVGIWDTCGYPEGALLRAVSAATASRRHYFADAFPQSDSLQPVPVLRDVAAKSTINTDRRFGSPFRWRRTRSAWLTRIVLWADLRETAASRRERRSRFVTARSGAWFAGRVGAAFWSFRGVV